MGCCASTALHPEIKVALPSNIKRLNYDSDLVLLKNVEDAMTMSFTGSTTTAPEGSCSWAFNPHGKDVHVDGDFSKPLLEPPSAARTAFNRFVIKFALALCLKHHSVFALVEEDGYGKPTNNVLAATCMVPPNNKHLHDPGVCEMMSFYSRIKPIAKEVMLPRMDAIQRVMTAGHKKWANDPHWYVMCFAANPEKQGQGNGRKLMGFVCSFADASNLNLYLETHGPKNRRFYERNGYECKQESKISSRGSGPDFEMHGGGLAMLRTPGAGSKA